MKMMSARDKKKDYLVPRLRFPEFRDTGEWGKVQLSKIAIPVSERATDGDADAVLTLSAEHGVVTQGSYFGKKIAGDDVTRYIKIKNNDFVYNDRTTKFYKYGTIKRLSRHTYGIVSPIYKCFRFNDEEIPVFWEWYFESGEHDTQLHNIVNEGAKAGRFNISIQKFLSIFVYFPDKSEQQRIADCLSSLDERIAAETTKLDRLKDHKNGLLKQLFPAEGETLPRLRFPEFQDAGEWEEVPLSKLVSSLDAGVSVNAGDRPATREEMGILKTSAVANGVFEPQENKVVLDVVEIGRMRESVRRDTIIISRMNTPALVGANAYVDTNFENIFLPDRLWAAKPKPDTSMRFISFILSSNQGRATLARSAKGSSGSMKNITKSDVLAFLAMIPSLPEQQRIADCLSSLDELIASQTQKIDLLKDHKKGLMQQLFPCIDEVRA